MKIDQFTEGDRFPDTRLTFQQRLPDTKSGRHTVQWVQTSCDCGKLHDCRFGSIQCGDTTSCGCLKKELSNIRLKTTKPNGARHSSLYKAWNNMKQRCTNKNSESYKNYGALGITYDPAWEKFKDFKLWAESHGYSTELTLERKKTNLNYTPRNCKWVTHKKQCQNMKKSCWWVIDNVAFDSLRDAACHHATSQYFIMKWMDTRENCKKVPKYKNNKPNRLPKGVENWSAVYMRK